jgi:hypothetical protein
VAERLGNPFVPFLLAALLVAELGLAIHHHRTSDELAQVTRSGVPRDRIDALFKLARRGDGGDLTRDLVIQSFETGDPWVRAFVLMRAAGPLDRKARDALLAGIGDAGERDLVARLSARRKTRAQISEIFEFISAGPPHHQRVAE